MHSVLPSRTIALSIRREYHEAYAFLLDPDNLPRWARAFCKSIQRSGTDWIVKTDEGQVSVRFSPKNEFGILDHFVTPAPGTTIHVPMRLVPNGGGCEVIFTLFRQLETTDSAWEEDMKMVQRDLLTLKEVLETQIA